MGKNIDLSAYRKLPTKAKLKRDLIIILLIGLIRVEINPNHPDNMQWVERAIHSGRDNISHAYTKAWEQFFAEYPLATRAQVIEFGKSMWDYFKRFR